MFKLWSELNKEAASKLKPDLGLRKWSSLNKSEKENVWKYLQRYFFDKNIKTISNFMGQIEGREYDFFGSTYSEQEKAKNRVLGTIFAIKEMYKAKNYVPNFLASDTLNSACTDFYTLFINGDEDIVLELLSIFAKSILIERHGHKIYREQNEGDSDYEERLRKWRWEDFNDFADYLNSVFKDFCLDVKLTQLGFTPKQEEKIETDIYIPAIKKLSNQKWKDVNRDLTDAFNDYRKGDDSSYSSCITHTVSAIQAFLQILVNGKTGSGDISKLIPKAKAQQLIPNDDLSSLFFDQLESFLAAERQKKGDAHPKKEYANEKSARLVLNLAMIFFEHSL